MLFVHDILEAIEKIEKYIEGYSYAEFQNDMKTKDAVVRNLEIKELCGFRRVHGRRHGCPNLCSG